MSVISPTITPMREAQWATVPTVDFSPLGKLYDTYQKSQANTLTIEQAKRDAANKALLAGVDPNAPDAPQKFIAAGDTASGLGLYKWQKEQALEAEKRRIQQEAIKSLGGGDGFTATPGVAAAAPPGTPPTPPSRPVGSLSELGNNVPAFAQGEGGGFTGFAAASGRPKVSFAGVNPDLLKAASETGTALGRPLQITSARDSKHTGGSLHYSGNAIDIRDRDMSAAERARTVAELQRRGFNVLVESDHIHASMPGGGAGGGGTAVAAAPPLPPARPATAPAPVVTAGLDPRLQGMTQNPAVMSDAGPQPMPGLGRPSEPAQPPQQPPPIAAAPQLQTGAPLGEPLTRVAQAGPMQLPPAAGGPPVPQPQAVTQPPVVPTQPTGAVTRGGQGALSEQEIAGQGPFPTKTMSQLRGALAGELPAGLQAAVVAEINRRATALGKVVTPAERQQIADEAEARRLGLITKREEATPERLAQEREKRDLENQKLKRDLNDSKYEYHTLNGELLRTEKGKSTPPERVAESSDYKKYVNDTEAFNSKVAPEQRKELVSPYEFIRAKTKTGEDKAADLAATRWDKQITYEREAANAVGEQLAAVGALRELTDPNTGGLRTGWQAGLERVASSLGIPTKNASQIQAYEAIIAKMTPQQKPEGYGSSSDFDAKMFGRALQSILNQPGGNAIISNTIEALATNRQARMDIILQHENGELTKGQAMKQLNDLSKQAHKLGVDAVRKGLTGTTKEEDDAYKAWKNK